MTKDLNWI